MPQPAPATMPIGVGHALDQVILTHLHGGTPKPRARHLVIDHPLAALADVAKALGPKRPGRHVAPARQRS